MWHKIVCGRMGQIVQVEWSRLGYAPGDTVIARMDIPPSGAVKVRCGTLGLVHGSGDHGNPTNTVCVKFDHREDSSDLRINVSPDRISKHDGAQQECSSGADVAPASNCEAESYAGRTMLETVEADLTTSAAAEPSISSGGPLSKNSNLDDPPATSGNLRVCELCGEQIDKREMKKHRKRECSMRVVDCPDCGVVRCSARSLPAHLREECEARPAICDLCEVQLLHKDIVYHLEHECCLREPRSILCKWYARL